MPLTHLSVPPTQNQIAAQQALYVKQQQQHHHQQIQSHMSATGPPGAQADFFNKPSLPDQLYGSFNQLSVTDNPAAAAAAVSVGVGVDCVAEGGVGLLILLLCT